MTVLILTGHFGMGHDSAAKAIEEEIKKEYKDTDIITLDFVTYMLPKFNKVIYSSFNLLAKKHYALYNKVNCMNEKVSSLPLRKTFKTRYEKLLNIYNPNIIISTWPVASRYISDYNQNRKDYVPCITCITDITDNSAWISPAISAYIVGDEKVKETLITSGIKPNKIFVGGIPVKSDFKMANPYSKRKSGKEILIMGGGLGIIPNLEKILEVLVPCKDLKITVITGNNKKLYNKYSKLYPSVLFLKYVENVDDYLRKSDIIITKPGGITMFECIYAELPMFVIKPFLDQEISNSYYIEENKIGKVLWDNDSYLEKELTDFINNEKTQNEIKDNMREIKSSVENNSITKAIETLEVSI